ncbi:hypothetical protein [Pseudoroseicyclus sp. CXY001]|uniref:hypothetical protein n=1 Tax=Pseudoroseicyclus sp. CXY001 TaxID=3242492 RepID=UPI003571070F
MTEKRFAVRWVSEGGDLVLRQFDQNTGAARRLSEEVQAGSKSAASSASVFVDMLNKESASFDTLKASLIPANANLKRYEDALGQIDVAVQRGRVSQAEANELISAAAVKYGQVEQASKSAADSASVLAAALDREEAEIEALRMALDPTYASTKRYEAAVTSLEQAVARGRLSQAEANELISTAAVKYGQVEQASKSAADSAAVFTQNIENQAREYASLRASLDPTFAAQQRYADAVRTTRAAVELGEVSQAEANATLALAKLRLDDVTAGSSRAAAAARGLGRGFDFRMGMMQLSQVGDMAIATGDPLRALAVQGSDIGMLFGGPVAIGIGMAASAALMLGGNILKAARDTEEAEEEARTFTEQLSETETAISRASEAMRLAGPNGGDDFIATYGAATETVRDMVNQMARMEEASAVASLSKLIEDALAPASIEVDRIFGDVGRALTGGMADGADEARAVIRQLETDIANMNALGTFVPQSMLDNLTVAKQELAAIEGRVSGIGNLANEITFDRSLLYDIAAVQEALSKAVEMGDFYGVAEGLGEFRRGLVATGQDISTEVIEQLIVAEDQARQMGAQFVEALMPLGNVDDQAFARLWENGGMELGTYNDKLAAATWEWEVLLGNAEASERATQASATAAGTLSIQLGSATSLAAQLVARLGQVPAAMAGIAGQIDGVIAGLERQDAAVRYQVELGVGAASATILAQRDELAALSGELGGVASAATFTADQIAAAYEAGTAKAARAEELTHSIAAGMDALAAAAAGGGGGAAGAMTEASEAAEELMDDLLDVARAAQEAREANIAFASSTIQSLTEAAAAGDLLGGFRDLGRQAGSSFYDALGEGRSIGDIFGSVELGGLFSGDGLAGIGAALSSAMPAIGAVTTAIQLIQGFSSSEVIAGGIRGQIGGGSRASDYETTRRTSFWGLSKNDSTSSEINAEVTAYLREASAVIRGEVRDLAGGLGLTAESLSGVVTKFDLDTQGMSADQAMSALTDELSDYQEQAAQAALGTKAYTLAGETALQTMARLTEAMGTYNDVQRMLGMDTLPETIKNAAKAADILDRVGASEFSAGADAYFRMYDDAEQLAILQRDLDKQLRGFGITASVESAEDLREVVDKLMDAGRAAAAAGAISLAGLVDQVEDLRTAMQTARDAARDQKLAKVESARDEVDNLELELARAQGNDDLVRQLELEARLADAQTEHAKKLIEQIYLQEEATRVAEEAKRAEEERLRSIEDAVRAAEGYKYYASLYDERRAVVDARAGRERLRDYGGSSSNGPTTIEMPRVEQILTRIQTSMEEMASSSRETVAATKRTEGNTRKMLGLQGAAKVSA